MHYFECCNSGVTPFDKGRGTKRLQMECLCYKSLTGLPGALLVYKYDKKIKINYRMAGNFCWVLIFAISRTVYGVAKIKTKNNLFQQ